MIGTSTSSTLALALSVALTAAACDRPEPSKSLALQDKEKRPVETWQQVGVVAGEDINRVYVVNSRSGLVCEHEFLDSPTEPGRRFSVVSCSLPGSLDR